MIISLFKSTGSLTDEQLMARVSGKDDERAYDELYRRHARRLMGFFLRQLNHDEALAADLTQDTFLRVWANRNNFVAEKSSSFYSLEGAPIRERSPLCILPVGKSTGRAGGESSFSPWLFRIAYNLCKNRYRHLAYEQAYEQEVKHTEQEAEDNTFDMQIDRDTFDRILQAELTKLPPDQRLLFSLRFEEDLSVPQIATIIGIPEGTVKSRLHSLTKRLRQFIIHNS